jgi:peptidoglycan-associated lipoprotein
MRHQPLSTLALGLAAALALSACASKPKPSATGPVEAPPAVGEPSPMAPGAGPSVAGLSALQADLAAQAGERVFFELDSYSLDDQAAATLSRQAEWLLRHPGVRALVAGNCDERGTREYNLALGARRAAAAKAFLVSRGVAASRLDTVSYGKERPIADGSDEAAWAQNRNAHTVLIDLGPA